MSVDQFLLSADTTDLNYPEIRPTLDLNFARTKTLDPRIDFTRASGGSYVGADGLIKYAGVNEARFDHDPATGESLGLLIEESRTNLVLQSEDFSTTWYNFNSSESVNAAVAPNGTVTADKLIPDVGVTNGLLRQDFGINAFPNDIPMCLSVYAKAAEFNNMSLSFYNNANTFCATGVDLATGTFTSGPFNATRSIESVGNGWYRIAIFFSSGTGSNNPNIRIICSNTGDGTSGIYLWGAQLEQGSFPTSYIPTQGSTRTRQSDNASMTGSNFSSWYNQSEGTVFASFKCDNWNSSNTFGKVFTINPAIFGVENNGFWIGNDANNSNTVRYRVRSGGVNQFGPANLTRNSNIVKSAIAVKSSDFAITINGNVPTTSSSGDLPQVMNSLTIGRDIVGIELFINGHISRLTYFPKRLPNAQLRALTN